jgi:RNA polymerase sigma-70 factor (family 1)
MSLPMAAFYPMDNLIYMNVVKPKANGFSINEFQQGQPGAFSYVFDHYYNAVRFFAARLLQDPLVAEDIAQETFIKLWEKHSGFNSPQAIKSFLYVTTRNACFNLMKKAQTGVKNHKLWSGVWDESEDFVLNQLTRTEVVREIYMILNMLPTECRKVMRYYFIEGKENQEIASLMNISVSTVKNQKTRAIYLIRKKLGNRSLLLIALALLQLRCFHAQMKQGKMISNPLNAYTPPALQATRTAPQNVQDTHFN